MIVVICADSIRHPTYLHDVRQDWHFDFYDWITVDQFTTTMVWLPEPDWDENDEPPLLWEVQGRIERDGRVVFGRCPDRAPR